MPKSYSSILYLRKLHQGLMKNDSDQNLTNRLREIEESHIDSLEFQISEYKCPEEFDKQLHKLLTEIITESKSTDLSISFDEQPYEIPFGYFLEMLLDENMRKDLTNAAAISDKDVKSAFGIVMENRTKTGSTQLYSDCYLKKKQESNKDIIKEHFSNHEPSISAFKEIIERHIDSDQVRIILGVKKILQIVVQYFKKIKGHKNSKAERLRKNLELLKLTKESNTLRRNENTLNSLNAHVEIYQMKNLTQLKNTKSITQKQCRYLGWDVKVIDSYRDCYEKARKKYQQQAESYSEGNASENSKPAKKKAAELYNKTNLTSLKDYSSLKPTDYFADVDSAINCLYKIYVDGERKNNYVPPELLYDFQKNNQKIYKIDQSYTKALEHIGKYAEEIKKGILPEARSNDDDEICYYYKEEGIGLFYKPGTDGREKLVNITWNTPSNLISKCFKEQLKDFESPERMVESFSKMLDFCDSYVSGTPVASMEIGNYDELKKSCLETIKSQKIFMTSAGSVVYYVLKHHLSKYTDPVTGKQFNLLKFTKEEAKRLIKDYFEKAKSSSDKFVFETEESQLKFYQEILKKLEPRTLFQYATVNKSTFQVFQQIQEKLVQKIAMKKIEIGKKNVYWTSKKSGRMFTLKEDVHTDDLKFFQPDNFLVDSSIFAHPMETFLRKLSTEDNKGSFKSKLFESFPNERKERILLLHEQCGIKMNENGMVERFDLPENLKTLSIGVKSIPTNLVANFLQTWRKEKKNLQRLRLTSFEEVSNKEERAEELLKDVKKKLIWTVTDHDETMFCDTNIEEYKEKLQTEYLFDDPVMLYFGASDDLSRLFSLVIFDFGIQLDFRPNDGKNGLDFLKQTFQTVTKVEDNTWVDNWLFKKIYREL